MIELVIACILLQYATYFSLSESPIISFKRGLRE